MAPKKAPKPNAFVLFAQDLQKQPGKKYPSLKDAVEGAAPLWGRMSSDQRKPYEDRARQMRGETHKLTSDGQNVEALVREQKVKNQAEERARQDIRNNLTMAHRANTLDTEVFFVVHCNMFCYYPNRDRYWPAEIAVLCFTLKDGVKPENIFHYIVNPGALPIGYKFEAKQHSDETHLIKVPFDDESNDNKDEIYYSLKAFLEKKKPAGTKRMPILYADKKYIKVVQNILNSWADDYDGEPDLFRIYNLQVLRLGTGASYVDHPVMFYFLRNIVAGGDIIWGSITFSDRELEKDVYAYVSEIACPFHASTAKPLFCSQSVVLRYAYVICDNCCPDMNIDFIEGQHVPLYSSIPDSVSTYGSTSSRTSKSGRSSRRGFDNDFETESNSDTWDTQSLASNSSASTSTSNLEDQFPSLGKSRSNSQASSFSDLTPNNSSSVKSYAGATGRSTLPHAFEKSMGDLSVDSGSRPTSGIGRGFRRRNNDSDSDLSNASGVHNNRIADFPPIGVARGRGFLPKPNRKPGPENN